MTLKVTKSVEIREDLGETALRYILEHVPIDYDLDTYYEDLDGSSEVNSHKIKFLDALQKQFEKAVTDYILAEG